MKKKNKLKLTNKELEAYSDILQEADKLKSSFTTVVPSLTNENFTSIVKATNSLLTTLNDGSLQIPHVSSALLNGLIDQSKQFKLTLDDTFDQITIAALPKLEGVIKLKDQGEQLANTFKSIKEGISLVAEPMIYAASSFLKQSDHLGMTLKNLIDPIVEFQKQIKADQEKAYKALDKLAELELTLNYPEGYLTKIYKESGRWMILKLHLIIQHLLVELINKQFKEKMAKSRDFEAISTWHFKEIYELSLHILEEKGKLANYCDHLNQLRNLFSHYPQLHDFKDLIKKEKNKDKALIIYKIKREEKPKIYDSDKIKLLWFNEGIGIIVYLLYRIYPDVITLSGYEVLTEKLSKQIKDD